MIAFYDNQPTKLEAVGNGSYVYRFNIQKVEKQATADTDETAVLAESPVQEQWKCEEVTVWPPITANKITEAMITEKWDSNYEQKLVNDYISVSMEIITEKTDEKVKAYKDFLIERKLVKEQIDKDCKELGIVE